MQAMDTLATRCVTGIEANAETCEKALENSLVLATMLVPHIGYAKAAKIARQALETGSSIPETALAMGLVTPEDLPRFLSP
jgi:aspartate ammonia-lyase